MREKFYAIIRENLKNPRLYVFLLILIIIGVMLFPYIDANFFYYSRVERRISILDKITKIDKSKINESSILLDEYNGILNEIDKQKDGSLGRVFNTNETRDNKLWKFVSGGAIIWLFAIASLFVKQKKLWYKLILFLTFVIFGGFAGYIAMSLPTVINIKCNIIVIPIIEIILLGLLLSNKQQKQ